MSRPTLEQISVALFARAAAIPGLVTASRELRPWADVPPSEQPALFHCEEHAVVPSPPAGVGGGRSVAPPAPWTLHVTWYVYQHRANTGGVGGPALLASAMNTLIDACQAALAPDVGQMAQTLGGLVADVRVAGEIARDGGVLGDQGVALVPIEVLTFPR